jgi:hypothetical protein
VLPFIDLLLTRYPAAFGDDILKYKEISSAMLNILRLIRKNPVVFPAADMEAATIRAIDRPIDTRIGRTSASDETNYIYMNI